MYKEVDLSLPYSARTRGVSRRVFHFSRFIFERMKAAGHTHYCFHCGGETGFVSGKNGKISETKQSGMKNHDPQSHSSGVVGNIRKHGDARQWINQEKPRDFPFSVEVR